VERNQQVIHKYLISLLLLSLPILPTQVGARESPPDWGHVVLMNVLLIVDHSETLYIATHPDEYYEKWNKMIPKYPSTGDVNRYFFVVTVALNGLVYVLDDVWSDRLMVAVEAVEVLAIGNNIGVGIKFSLP